MMLKLLALTFSPKKRSKPHSFGRPTNSQDMDTLEPTDAPTSFNKSPPPPAVCSSQLVE